MKNKIPFFLLFFSSLFASPESRYNALDPNSFSQHIAYYILHKEHPLGNKALESAWKLIQTDPEKITTPPTAVTENIECFLACIDPNFDKKVLFSKEQVASVNELVKGLAKGLANRKRKGHMAMSIKELEALPSDEIDISRALLLTEYSADDEIVNSTEAMLDLMAIECLAHLPENASNFEKKEAIIQHIFFDLGFQFPPHSSYSTQIDQFTFLPQILESKKGVCLGVSCLFLALADRLDLPLEAVTPPGHIYLRIPDGDNIETTNRGVHIPTDKYLSLNTKSLPVRSHKEVIGLVQVNHASTYLAKGDFSKAKTCYEKARRFVKDDQLIDTLYAATLFLLDEDKKATEILKNLPDDPHTISQSTLGQDILQKKVTKEALQAYLLYTDNRYESLIEKKTKLEKALEKAPYFQEGQFQLALLYMQLNKPKEAITILQKLSMMSSNNIVVEGFLTDLLFSRYLLFDAKKHLTKAYAIAKKQDSIPKALEEIAQTVKTRATFHE